MNFQIKIGNGIINSEDVLRVLQWGRSQAIAYIKQQTHCTDSDAIEVVNDISHMQSLIKYPPAMQQKEEHLRLQDSSTYGEAENIIKCPRCGSTQISTGARGWKWTTGFIGSSKTVNRCANCGNTWTPNWLDRQK